MATSDIIIGPATIYYAPVGETEPDPDSVDFGDPWGGNWTKIALTLSPVSVNREISTTDVMVEQSTLPARRVVTEEKVTLETSLAEFLGASIHLGMGGTLTVTSPGAGQVGMSEVQSGGASTLAEKAWGIEGEYITAAGVSLPVRIFVFRATAVFNGALEFGKAAPAGIPLRIETLGDFGKTVAAGQLWKIQIVTAPGT